MIGYQLHRLCGVGVVTVLTCDGNTVEGSGREWFRDDFSTCLEDQRKPSQAKL
jgi:hypothetical protein